MTSWIAGRSANLVQSLPHPLANPHLQNSPTCWVFLCKFPGWMGKDKMEAQKSKSQGSNPFMTFFIVEICSRWLMSETENDYCRCHYRCSTLVEIHDHPLVGGIPTPLTKIWKSVGMMNIPIYGNIQFMFQATNQSAVLHRYSMFLMACWPQNQYPHSLRWPPRILPHMPAADFLQAVDRQLTHVFRWRIDK